MFAAVGSNVAAAYGDGAAGASIAAADACVMIANILSNQLADTVSHVACLIQYGLCLSVDGQGVGTGSAWIVVIILHLNAAVCGKVTAVHQDQVNFAADGDAGACCHRAAYRVPAGGQRTVAADIIGGENCASCRFLIAGFV